MVDFYSNISIIVIDGPYLRNNCVQKPIFVEIIVL